MVINMWNKNFVMVVIGQIISLFGNAILRFALPLYLLNVTGSAVLFGVVSACAFIPMIVLSPVGGIIADRVNKRNIMVVLDFMTAGLVIVVLVLLEGVNPVTLIFAALFVLYGIQGTYQPAVQASIPILLPADRIMQGNAVVNLVSSFSGLLGPVIGGSLFGFFGITSILYVSGICFFISAVMEIFITIPFEKRKAEGNIFATGFSDMRDCFRYMRKDQPLILRFSFAVAAINLILSALMIIGLPIIVTQMLGFDSEQANVLYGYAEGAMGLGSLAGGMGAGLLAGKIKARSGYLLLMVDALPLFPIGAVLAFSIQGIPAYIIIMISCFIMMFLATLFSVQIMSYLQMIVPSELLGKVISCAMCVGMCATPLGQAVYGTLFEVMERNVYIVFFIAAILIIGLALIMKKSFVRLAEVVEK